MTGRQKTSKHRRITVTTIAVALSLIMSRLWKWREADKGIRDRPAVRRLYDRLAPVYDLASAPYRCLGAGNWIDASVAELRLQEGDTVIDLGTGTGRFLEPLATAVGPTGRVIGVDLSPGMIAQAEQKVRNKQLQDTVELVISDMGQYQPPPDLKAVVSSFSIEMLPDYDETIARYVDQLRTGGRIVITGMREPEDWPEWLIRIGSLLNRPFGVSAAYRAHSPWESIRRHTVDYSYTETLAGAVYRAAGTAPD